jgi:hypothetical protein
MTERSFFVGASRRIPAARCANDFVALVSLL